MSNAAWAPLLVFLGAGCGALLRWGLGLYLNEAPPGWPWGTLAANLIGGMAIGVLWPLLDQAATLGWSPEFARASRVLLVTGLLGGLTTFSTFSVEVVGYMAQARWLEAGAWAALHLAGSLALTAAGWVAGSHLVAAAARAA